MVLLSPTKHILEELELRVRGGDKEKGRPERWY
jgi:hypothetical protein